MKNNYKDQIYLGTVLLEKNRWAQVRTPTINISELLPHIANAGFDGLELWQNHALLASPKEKELLANSKLPVKILNSYARCESEHENERNASVELAKYLSVLGMKYNSGKDHNKHEEYCLNIKKWREMLPDDFRFLCECHGGTTLQKHNEAVNVLQKIIGDQYEVIIHAFGCDEKALKNLFEIHGHHITHIHANLSHRTSLTESDIQSKINLMRELGFNGSYTIEFTEGVGEENENPETLLRNAIRDFALLKKFLEK